MNCNFGFLGIIFSFVKNFLWLSPTTLIIQIYRQIFWKIDLDNKKIFLQHQVGGRN